MAAPAIVPEGAPTADAVGFQNILYLREFTCR
jgi:hypothetical protein